MGDFIRFLTMGACTLDLTQIEAELRALDTNFSVRPDQAEPTAGEVLHESVVVCDIELNTPGDVLFDEDMAELRDILADSGVSEAVALAERLGSVAQMAAFGLTQAGHDTYDLIDPLWDRLFALCPDGLLQVDEEGYYDKSGELLTFD